MTLEEKRQLEAADLHELLSLPAGRRIFYALIERCGVLSDSFGDGSHARMAAIAGRRSIGIELVAWLQEVTPKLYVEMVLEAAKRAAEESLAKP